MATNSPDPAPETADADLVRQALQGSREAFAVLVRRYYRPVCAFVLKRVGQPSLVEDLVQETFLEAYRSLRSGQAPTTFAGWLFGIAHNRCGKWLRRRRPVLFPATEPPDIMVVPFGGIGEQDEQQRLLTQLGAGLAALPAEVQELIRLKHQQGKTCDEIAAALGRPVGTVKSQLARAYKSLRIHLREHLGSTD